MSDKRYIITDGIKYIKLNSQKDPIKTTDVALATVFNSLLEANSYLLDNKMKKINSDNGKRKFNIEELESIFDFIKPIEDKKIAEEIYPEIQALDGEFKDFEDIKLSDNDNKHIYAGKTFMESDDFDFAGFLTTAITVFSQLDIYIENMACMEREVDLKLLDARHYKRDINTRMNAIEAQKLEYYEQELERDRIAYKRNKTIGSIISKDLERLKKNQYIKVIDNVINSEYRYRRTGKDDIEEIIKSRKSKLKVV